MVKINLYDPSAGKTLWPFSVLQSPAFLPVGLWNITEQYAQLGMDLSILDSWPSIFTQKIIIADAHIVPNTDIVRCIRSLVPGEGIKAGNRFIICIQNGAVYNSFAEAVEYINTMEDVSADTLEHATDLLKHRKSALAEQLESVLGGEDLFVHSDATADHVFFDTSSGPIYIDEHAKVMAGSCIKGPVYIGRNALIKMGATIYGPTHIGDHCVVNGEVNRVQMLFGANKGHEGYLGDSVLGRFTNLGALTTTSNLRNSFTNISIYNRLSQSFVDSGLQKCGVLLGDYSRTAIQTKIAAGTTIGVSCNLVSDHFLPRYLDSFTWLHQNEPGLYQWKKAKAAITQLHKWKDHNITEAELHKLNLLHASVSDLK